METKIFGVEDAFLTFGVVVEPGRIMAGQFDSLSQKTITNGIDINTSRNEVFVGSYVPVGFKGYNENWRLSGVLHSQDFVFIGNFWENVPCQGVMVIEGSNRGYSFTPEISEMQEWHNNSENFLEEQKPVVSSVIASVEEIMEDGMINRVLYELGNYCELSRAELDEIVREHNDSQLFHELNSAEAKEIKSMLEGKLEEIQEAISSFLPEEADDGPDE